MKKEMGKKQSVPAGQMGKHVGGNGDSMARKGKASTVPAGQHGKLTK